jgi:hypothetical protein
MPRGLPWPLREPDAWMWFDGAAVAALPVKVGFAAPGRLLISASSLAL